MEREQPADRKMSPAAALVEAGEAMSPEESIETRVGKHDVQITSLEHQHRALAPLAGQLPLLMQEIQTLNANLSRHEREGRERAERIEREAREDRERDAKMHTDALERLARSFGDQILVVTDGLHTCSTKVGELAQSQKEWQDAEAKRRQDEAKAAKDETKQDVVSRRTLYGVLGAAGLAAFAAIVAPILNAILG